MKFSILLPTRNRLELLRYAIESVRMQDDPDWEVVVSDNASSEDVSGFVVSLADPRMRCIRSDAFLPVTENWNVALSQSTGEYLIMLGDDDALLPQCLRRARLLIEQWQNPDALYVQAVQFAYPGVIPGHESGFVQLGYNEFFRERDQPFLLERGTAEDMVGHAMGFRIRYGFNMQHFIFSRRLVDALKAKGPFFQSPYPDYYAANAILLGADRILAEPRPMVMIGISPKSFGFYYFNRREDEGVSFLQNAPAAANPSSPVKPLLPGSNMNDSWLSAMEMLARNYPDRPAELRVDYRRYRLLQYHALLRLKGRAAIPLLIRYGKLVDALWYAPLAAAYVLAYLFPPKLRASAQEKMRALLSAYPRFDPHRAEVHYANILEAAREYEVR